LKPARWLPVILSLTACGDPGSDAAAPIEQVADDAQRFHAVTAARIDNADREPGNWLSHGRTYDEQRYSTLTNINDGNVGNLGLAWHFDIDTNRSMEATPLVADGVMYVSIPWSIVYALDAGTGELKWTFDPQTPRSWGAYACCDVPNRGVALWNDKVYVATFDGYLIAIDAQTGDEVWRTDTIGRTPPYTITGAPRVIKGKVIIGNGGAEFGVRGYVSAYDAETGEQIWRTYTVPGNPADGFENDAMRAAAETWTGEWWKFGGGGTAWDAFAYDPDLDLLYVGVGNGSPWNREIRSPGGGDNLYLSSILALDPDDGEYRWHYQTTPGETWDYTATQHMILADLEIDGEMRQVIMQAPKNGFFYVVDRVTGKLISAEPFIPVNWASHIDLDTGRPVETPGARYEIEQKIIFPGAWGGHNWHPMTYSPDTGLVYIPIIGSSESFANPGEFEFFDNHLNTAIDWQTVADVPAEDVAEKPYVSARVSAWDPVTQEERFRIDSGSGWNAGLLSTAGNLVFQGEASGEFAAYKADDGTHLWSGHAGTGIQAAPVTYEVDGEQYVAVIGGWGGSLGLFDGDPGPNPELQAVGRVLVYKLGSSESLPPATVIEYRLPDVAEPQVSEAELDRGGVLFLERCSWCHGYAAVGNGSFPDLRYASEATHSIWNSILLDGAYLPKGMPTFAGVLSEDDAEAIRAYVIRQGRLTTETAAE
jgi:PQQ-dependent dehydrogenase (methanol/ethanol family)